MHSMSAAWGELTAQERFASDHVPPRTLYVWRPPSSGPYRVLFMQDGEKVFADESQGTHSWRVPEAMKELQERTGVEPPLVVAVSANENRAGEYMPQKALTGPKAALFHDAHKNRHYVARSDAYLEFMVEELLPWIKASYPVLDGSPNRALMGCSRGALLSIYALCEYPHLYGSAACLSSHWPHGDGIMIEWLESHLPLPGEHRFYFDYGDQGLDAAYEPYQKRMDELMRSRGYRDGHDWLTLFFSGHGHSERYWAERLLRPLEFLYAEEQHEA